MIDFKKYFKRKNQKETVTLMPQMITFEYARINPEVQVMERLKSNGPLTPIKHVEPFTGFKAKTIGDVDRIFTGPENSGITIRNVVEYIEEPCIPAFFKLQNLGIQTYWSSANNRDKYATIEIKTETLSKENMDIAIANNLYKYFDINLSFPIEKNNSVQEVSDKLLKLCSVFVEQPVLYGQKNQTEHLNDYSKYDSSYMAENSNIDVNYVKDHLYYLLNTFPQYISFNEGKYSCINMPDETFQKEILDREIFCKFFHSEPQVCIKGTIWASRELYDINERNTNPKLNKSNIDTKSFDNLEDEQAQNDFDTSSIDKIGRTR